MSFPPDPDYPRSPTPPLAVPPFAPRATPTSSRITIEARSFASITLRSDSCKEMQLAQKDGTPHENVKLMLDLGAQPSPAISVIEPAQDGVKRVRHEFIYIPPTDDSAHLEFSGPNEAKDRGDRTPATTNYTGLNTAPANIAHRRPLRQEAGTQGYGPPLSTFQSPGFEPAWANGISPSTAADHPFGGFPTFEEYELHFRYMERRWNECTRDFHELAKVFREKKREYRRNQGSY